MDPLSDWEQPIPESELEAIEAAFDSASSLFKRRKTTNTPLTDDGPPTPYFLRPHRVSVNTTMKYPTYKFGGRIVYCRTYSEVEKATVELMEHIQDKQKNVDRFMIGFDIEWKPTFKRGAVPRKGAVMQICGDMSRCYVFHIIHSGIPINLQSFLEDPKYVKVGVWIGGDADKIYNDYNIRIQSIEELSCLANKKLDGFHRRWSLAALTETLTSKELEKPNKIRLGNWEVEVLSRDQLLYAATDAFASWQLYEILKTFPDLSEKQNEQEVNGLQSKRQLNE
ncbi:hypothetical protein IFM89_022200 [Coptis chinensis]|uniref:3'-5' exonuclease n=1 Tax=Coptis chinensis TaxID=261450 RepID=A0A835M0B9_9MAGN|nr:hypothetical protein IFM89_022200 [Coptis chinensis]